MLALMALLDNADSLGIAAHTSWVPLPWWTSQSTMSTRLQEGTARWAALAATATLLKRQKPIEPQHDAAHGMWGVPIR